MSRGLDIPLSNPLDIPLSNPRLTTGTSRVYQWLATMFTAETASQMGRKGAAIRWQRQREREALPPEPIPLPPIIPALPAINPLLAARAERLSDELTRLEELMKDETDGKELANLSATHQRLFDAWCTLTATPRPGSRKPAPARRSALAGSGSGAPAALLPGVQLGTAETV